MAKDLVAFTVRIPRGLIQQIDARASINHRKRNGEINALLEWAIDIQTESDRKLLNSLRDRTADEA